MTQQSAAGYQTLADLRLYELERGRVTLDGIDIRDLDPGWLRQQVGVVEQRPVLFTGTVEENIRFGQPEVSRADVERAAAQANALQFITGFPDGFDTVVGERGVTLSGGQIQRVAIARAILKDPKILILDEATSALDSESEQLVQQALERLMVGRTTIQIAHRLSTITNSSSIAVLQNGAVAELGTYHELMTMPEGGIFRELVERQKLALA